MAATSLEGRIAIVTGGSRGIGRELCLTLGRHGASVMVNYQISAQKAEEVVSLIRAAGGKAASAQADISDPAQVTSLFDRAEQELGGKPHIVVHMAAVANPTCPKLEDMEVEDWDRTMAVNARGTFLVCKESAKRIVRGGGGRIVTCSTSLVHILLPGYGTYVASKAAAEAVTKTLAKELRGSKITANIVAPGAVITDLFLAGKSEATIENIRKAPPLERLGEPKDIAGLVLFLVSDAGELVNGQVIRANGGLAI